MRHCSTQWKLMEECLRDIWNIGVEYEKAKGYCRAESNTPEASLITEVNTTKKLGLCYKKGNNSNKFQNKTPTQQNYQGNNSTYKFCNNKNNSNMFPTGTLSSQVSHIIRSSDDMSLNIDTIKCFLENMSKNIVSRRDQTTSKESLQCYVWQCYVYLSLRVSRGIGLCI